MISPFEVYAARTLALLAATAFLAGLARGFSGFGAALIFMPLASALVAPQVAAPLLLVVDGVLALGLVPRAWGRADRREVATMSLGALAGIPAGTWLLIRLEPVPLRWAIAALTASFLVLLLSGWRYRGRPAASLTVAVGALAGLFSGVAQAGGPPVVSYWLGGATAAAAVRANIVVYFLISTALSFVSYLAGGLLTGAVIGLALVTAPAYGGGLLLGSRLFGLASEAVFRGICYALIAAAALAGLPIFDAVLR